MKRLFFAFSLLCVLLPAFFFVPAPAQAEQLIKLEPGMRLLRGTAGQGEVSYDALVSYLSPEQLPGSIQEELKARLVSYAGDSKQFDSLVVYIWDSPWFHAQNRPPNYVIDFSKIVAPAKAKGDFDAPVCNEEGCLLIGYSFFVSGSNATWKQDFELRSRKTGFVRVPLSNNQDFQVEIQTVSGKKICDDGVPNGDDCIRRFEWRKFGLALLPPS